MGQHKKRKALKRYYDLATKRLSAKITSKQEKELEKIEKALNKSDKHLGREMVSRIQEFGREFKKLEELRKKLEKQIARHL